MRFASFQFEGREQIGLVNSKTELLRPVGAADMIDLINRFDDFKAAGFAGEREVSFHDVSLMAPI